MGEFQRHTSTSRAVTAGAVAAVLLTGLAGCSLFGGTANASSSTPSASSGDIVDPSVPSESPTPSDPATEATPSVTPSDSASATPSAAPVSTKKRVVPFITSAEWDPKAKELDVSGIVPSVLEKSGTCTVTASLGSTTRTDSAAAVDASSYTGCETVVFKNLAAGSWSVRIAYTSSTSAGVSAARTVTVG